MKFSYFISQRWLKSQSKAKNLSSPIIKLGVAAVGLSVAVMILSIAIVTGFQEEIRNRVVGFGSHIQIVNFDSNNSFETNPIQKNLSVIETIRALPGIKNVQPFGTKPGIIKTQDDILGIIAKGVDENFDWEFFESNLVKGSIININDSTTTNDIVISETIASLLKIDVGDEIATFFIDERPRPRRFKIAGIYQTSLKEFDKQFILVDLKHIQRLNEWNNNQISGFEVNLYDSKEIDYWTYEIMNMTGYQFLDDGSRLRVISITDKYAHIFDWLNLLDMNVIVILLIMSAISIINMISVLIIIILDRISAIGLLKALGATNKTIKNIFLNQAVFIIFRGVLIGNIIAVSLGVLQEKFHILKLNEESYFIDYAPVSIKMGWLILLNIIAVLFILFFMILPTAMVSKVEPVKTLRYE